MNSINFTNPFLLLIGILLIGFVVVPFFVQIKKSGFNFHNITSLIIHIIISVLVTLSLSQMKLTLTITQTDVYVLADCSYSSIKNLDTIDNYITNLNKNLPSNSKMGIICYANDYEMITPLGGKIKSVSEADIDDSQTNVRPALEYATTLFNYDSIKRIVVISDGGQTNEESIKGLINDYESNDIHIDAIFLDNNLTEDANEFQISSVEYNLNTYIDNQEDANIIIDSNKDVMARLVVTDYSKTIYEELISLNKGSNNFIINLDTSTEGIHSYEAKLLEYTDKENTSKTDTNPYNNIYYFDQSVNKTINILYLSNDSTNADIEFEEFKELYSDSRYKIDKYINQEEVPYLLEDLCKYDQIVLNNFNVGLSSFSSYANTFVYNLNLAVSEYGKSLITFGNTNVQNSNGDDTLYTLGSMLPISYDESLTNMSSYVILLDISKSMTQVSHLQVAKQVAYNYLDLLNNNDYFTIIPFYGDNYELFSGKATTKNIEYTKELIEALEGKQATNIGGALQHAYDKLTISNYQNKHVLLISDGLSYSTDNSNVSSIIKSMNDLNISIDLVYVNENESNDTKQLREAIQSVGGKKYTITTLEEANGDVFDEISSEKKDVFKNKGNYNISINLKNNKVVEGITSLSNTINDFYGGVAKSSADTILTTIDSSVTYPIYSTWNYGNGRVSTLSSSISNFYKPDISNENVFLSNIVPTSTSKMKNNTTLIVDVTLNGSITEVSVTPASFNKKINMVLTIIDPKGNTTSYNMNISNNNYYYSFESIISGSYKIDITYGTQSYCQMMNISYLSEYNSFINYNSAFLYTLITSDGKVSEDGHLVISNEGLPVQTFTYEFAPLFMIISCVLFVCDIIIRKLRWQDVKDIFKHHHKEGK